MTTFLRRTFAVGGLALGVATAAPPSADAQGTATRWRAWVGCWTAATVSMDPATYSVICITPTANPDVVELGTIMGGKLVARDTIDASGKDDAVAGGECDGVQNARWSADERRVYLKSSVTCAGTQKTMVNAILAMSPSGEWLDVRGLRSGEGETVRVAQYRAVPIPAALMDSFPAPVRSQLAAGMGARIAAGAPIGTAAVIEASKAVDAAVVEAWLLERGGTFDLDAKTLVALSDAGVPSRVTDAMIAVSHPSAFQVARAARASVDDDRVTGSRVFVNMPGRYDPYGDRYGYGGYGYDPYGYRYGYGYGYGYGRYGTGYNNGYGRGYYPPIVIVNGGGAGEARATMVRGRGYAQEGGPTVSSPARERERSSGSTSTSRASGNSNSGSASSGSASGSSGSSSGTRTAKPRDP